jgi:hypothetical protein
VAYPEPNLVRSFIFAISVVIASPEQGSLASPLAQIPGHLRNTQELIYHGRSRSCGSLPILNSSGKRVLMLTMRGNHETHETHEMKTKKSNDDASVFDFRVVAEVHNQAEFVARGLGAPMIR